MLSSTSTSVVSADRPFDRSTRVTLDDPVTVFEDARLDFEPDLLRGIHSHGFEFPNTLQEGSLLPLLGHHQSAEMRAVLLAQNERLSFYSEEICINFEHFYPACATTSASSIVFLSSAPQLGRFRISLSSGWTSHREIESSTILFDDDIDERRGNDVMLVGSAGCGKTSALVLSMLRNLDSRENTGLQAIYLCPTREVATQTFRMISSLSEFVRPPFSILKLVGGVRIQSDILKLGEDQTQIIVGTPGRVKFLLEFFAEREMDGFEGKSLRLRDLQMLILDEFDDLMSSGYEEQLIELFGFLRQRTEGFQTCLSTSCFPPDCRNFCREYLTDPIRLTLRREYLTIEKIHHYYVDVSEEQYKLPTLFDVLASVSRPSAIIFCNTKRTVELVHARMKEEGIVVCKGHSDLSRDDALATLRSFRDGQSLVCTDSFHSSRWFGIYTQSCSLSIHYDFPRRPEYYLHRIARCGRFDPKCGVSIAFVTRSDPSSIAALQEYSQIRIVPLPAERDDLADL